MEFHLTSYHLPMSTPAHSASWLTNHDSSQTESLHLCLEATPLTYSKVLLQHVSSLSHQFCFSPLLDFSNHQKRKIFHPSLLPQQQNCLWELSMPAVSGHSAQAVTSTILRALLRSRSLVASCWEIQWSQHSPHLTPISSTSEYITPSPYTLSPGFQDTKLACFSSDFTGPSFSVFFVNFSSFPRPLTTEVIQG